MDNYLRIIKNIIKDCTEIILKSNANGFINVNPITGLSKPRIVCAAIRSSIDGSIIIGARHYDSHMQAVLLKHRECSDNGGEIYETPWRGSKRKSQHEDMEQGFIDQHGNFYTRESAWVVAVENNQIIRSISGCEGTLYSENLY